MNTRNTSKIKHDHGGIERQKEGISSINKLDSSFVFKELALKKGDVFLDIGCGAADYSFRASSIVGDSGYVYAMDKWEELIAKINASIDDKNIKNMRAIVGDVTQALPVSDKSIDVCFIATVLHGIDKEKQAPLLFAEVSRVLKTGGQLAVVEIKKETASEGHPAHILFSPEEIGDFVAKYDFKQLGYVDMGRFYLARYGARQ